MNAVHVAALCRARHHRDPATIEKGTLIRHKRTGLFAYVVGVMGHTGGPVVYMLAPHPEQSWQSLVDASQVETA
jgi:hypothetical protein